MRAILRILVLAGVSVAMKVWADSEIVIAIRYLQAEGASHSHLYLYREDGKLLRQLTNDNSGQDSGPISRLTARALSSCAKNLITLANFGALILSAKH
jgi:hypothetical protein